ncbi:hypothetical protein BCEN4_20040 [Burkholderia cenocepacia]|nr:hypothetical protein BCEN4_20040 [Burkholderia cenocepacia]
MMCSAAFTGTTAPHTLVSNCLKFESAHSFGTLSAAAHIARKPLIQMKNKARPIYLSNNVQCLSDTFAVRCARRSIDSLSTSNDKQAHDSISG